MGLSSNTLIHQSNFDSLKKILISNEFKMSYSKEEFTHINQEGPSTYIHVFPMICFSEIPIASLQNHLHRYGSCIIGMDKPWAIVNGLNQVHYYQQQSVLAHSLFKTYHYFFKKIKATPIKLEDKQYQDLQRTFNNLEYQMAFAKNYSGAVRSGRYKAPNYVFAEEKEWRLVPENTDPTGPLSLSPKLFNEDKLKYQKEIGEITLEFELDDINYLVFETEEQKKEVRKLLQLEHSEKHINLFTNDEIKKNFFGFNNLSIDEYESINRIKSLEKQLKKNKVRRKG